jgi:hypothetical protein
MFALLLHGYGREKETKPDLVTVTHSFPSGLGSCTYFAFSSGSLLSFLFLLLIISLLLSLPLIFSGLRVGTRLINKFDRLYPLSIPWPD